MSRTNSHFLAWVATGFVVTNLFSHSVVAQLEEIQPEFLAPTPLDKIVGSPKLEAPAPLNNLFLNQWVKTDADGVLRGSVVTLVGEDTLSVSGTRISLVQRGKVLMTVDSNIDGDFSFIAVPSGYYSLVAEADSSFATFAIAVVTNTLGSHLPNTVEVRVIRPKTEVVKELIQRETVPQSISETRPDSTLKDPIGPSRKFADSHLIYANKDGAVIGSLTKQGFAPGQIDMTGMKAFLLKDGKTIDTATVQRDGSFRFPSVAPGTYGFVGAGKHGVAAFSFGVATPNNVTLQIDKIRQRFVATSMLVPASVLNAEVADSGDLVTTQTEDPVDPDKTAEEEVLAAPLPAPIVGANMAGAGQVIGGGGSGYGGLGGALSGLAPLAALGAIGYAIANNDDNNNNNQQIVSPVVVITN